MKKEKDTRLVALNDFTGLFEDEDCRRHVIENLVEAKGEGERAEKLAEFLMQMRNAIRKESPSNADLYREFNGFLAITFERSEFYHLAFDLYTNPEFLDEGKDSAIERFRCYVSSELGDYEKEARQSPGKAERQVKP